MIVVRSNPLQFESMEGSSSCALSSSSPATLSKKTKRVQQQDNLGVGRKKRAKRGATPDQEDFLEFPNEEKVMESSREGLVDLKQNNKNKTLPLLEEVQGEGEEGETEETEQEEFEEEEDEEDGFADGLGLDDFDDELLDGDTPSGSPHSTATLRQLSLGSGYDDSSRPSSPLVTLATSDKRALRKKRNREAAAKCRERRRETIKALQEVKEEQIAINEKLQADIERTRQQINLLSQSLARHVCSAPESFSYSCTDASNLSEVEFDPLINDLLDIVDENTLFGF